MAGSKATYAGSIKNSGAQNVKAPIAPASKKGASSVTKSNTDLRSGK